MKNTLVIFKNAEEELPYAHIRNLSNLFYSSAITFSSLEVLSASDETGLKVVLERNRIASDNLFLLASESITFDIKKVVSEVMETNYFRNEKASEALNNYNKTFNGNISPEMSMIPVDAIYIPNNVKPFNSFMLEDGNFSLIYLPDDEKTVGGIIEGFIVRYFENKYDLKKEVFVAKHFGDKDRLFFALHEIEKKYPFVKYIVERKYGDSLVKLVFNGSVCKREYDDVLRLFMTRLEGDIYAEFDTSLSARLFDLLKLRSLRISTAESFTAGRIASSIVENAGASAYFQEGIVCYSNMSKIKRVGVKMEDLNVVGAVSSKVAYQMAIGLLNEGNCDVAISTTGYAGPTTDEDGKPLGLFYIGIGMRNGVDVYKYQGSGSREEITEFAKNTALFLAIKKLKKI